MTEADLAKTLEGLSAAATQGEWSTDGLDQGMQLWAETYIGETREYDGDDAEFITALVNAYRTGQLIVAQAGDVPSLAAKDAEIARLREALHDTIRSPKGVVPVSAEPFYEPSRCTP